MSEAETPKRSCKSCAHVIVCKAYETVAITFKQIEKQNGDFLKLPMSPDMIALGCSQYESIVPTKELDR